VTPVIYVYMENFSGWLVGLWSKRKGETGPVEAGDQPSLFKPREDMLPEPQQAAAE
jgi:hydrophobic/amphiphilic exporter-1 (mainly G- bacteria), HAE1 family